MFGTQSIARVNLVRGPLADVAVLAAVVGALVVAAAVVAGAEVVAAVVATVVVAAAVVTAAEVCETVVEGTAVVAEAVVAAVVVLTAGAVVGATVAGADVLVASPQARSRLLKPSNTASKIEILKTFDNSSLLNLFCNPGLFPPGLLPVIPGHYPVLYN